MRSGTSLIQTAGRTARHVNGRVILYADKVTDAMRQMMEVTKARRAKQEAYNTEHGLMPQSVKRAINESLALYSEARRVEERMVAAESHERYDVHRVIADSEAEMLAAAGALEFERAALLRDEIRELKRMLAGPAGTASSPSKTRESSQKKRRGPAEKSR